MLCKWGTPATNTAAKYTCSSFSPDAFAVLGHFQGSAGTHLECFGVIRCCLDVRKCAHDWKDANIKGLHTKGGEIGCSHSRRIHPIAHDGEGLPEIVGDKLGFFLDEARMFPEEQRILEREINH